MFDDKRKRSPNWLPSEKMLLLQLVEKHFKIVENKKTDGVSIKAKLAEWQIISIEYNSQTTHCHREAENLKSQWESMKKAAKKEASNARMRRIQTGGGPPHEKKEDPVYSRIISLIQTSAVGLYNPYDNDSMVPVQADSETATATTSELENFPGSCNTGDIKEINGVDAPLSVTVEDMGSTSVEMEIMDWGAYTPNNVLNSSVSNGIDVKSTICETQSQVSIKKDWGDYTPQLLKTPVSTQLKVTNKNKTNMSRRRPIHAPAASSLESLHRSKIDAIHLQKVLAEKEAETNKTIAELDIEIKKEILKQEKLKTKLLLLELRKKKEFNKNVDTNN